MLRMGRPEVYFSVRRPYYRSKNNVRGEISLESLWTHDLSPAPRPTLSGTAETDTAIIGAGMAGILTAHMLEKQGLPVLLLEADRIGGGQTGNTTAKITSQHGLIYQRLLRYWGSDAAALYAKASQQAVAEYRRLVQAYGISCDFEDCSSFLYSCLDKAPLEREMEAARRAGIPARLSERTELPFSVRAALEFPGQARFHPEKFLQAMAKSMSVYEKSPVQRVIFEGPSRSRLLTPNGEVRARRVVFACHFPFINFPGFYFLKMHQERSYALALAGAAPLSGSYLCIDSGGWSMRSSGDFLIVGGGKHRTGTAVQGYPPLRDFAARHWSEAREVFCWSAQDCITLDGLPYIGHFSPSRPGWYIATGFGKWGMTHSMAAARLIADLILGTPSMYEPLFAPNRFSLLPSIREITANAACSTKSFARRFLTYPFKSASALPLDSGGIVRFRGKKAGVYRDGSGRIFPVSPRCPHLGCQLTWNPSEKTWDCPCHGSRFDVRGNLIDAPAQKGISDRS